MYSPPPSKAVVCQSSMAAVLGARRPCSFQVMGAVPQSRLAILTALYRNTALYRDTASLGGGGTVIRTDYGMRE